MPTAALSWRPGRATWAILFAATLAGTWLLSPVWWARLGNDSQVFYAAATVAKDGGNPYDFHALRAAEHRVNQNQQAGSRGAFSPAPYAYPPLMTRLWQLLLPLGERGFYWANAGILFAAGLLGTALLVLALGFRDRVLAIVAMVVSVAFILGLVAGNPSNVVFLAWAGAFYSISRGHPTLGGGLLALTLIKAPVGLGVAAALVLASPAVRAALGLLVGSAIFLSLNLLALGQGALQSWVQSLGGYSSTLVPSAGTGYVQCCLAGLPSVLADRAPIVTATLASVVLIMAAIALAARRPEWRHALAADPLARVALLTAAVLVASPYLHLNDLVLEAVPLLFVASRRLGAAGRVLLVTWGLGVIPPLAISLLLGILLHTQAVSAIGFGLLLSTGALLAVIMAIGAGIEPPPAVAPQRR